MKAFKAGSQLGNWLLRIALGMYFYFIYFDLFTTFNTSSLHFYLAGFYLLFGLLLLIGGFFHNDSLTVFSGLLLFLLSIFGVISIQWVNNLISADTADYYLIIAISFYFLTKGNKA